jgi:multidrug efflux pump subunit AcrA (membrane-fusion protein)
MKRTAIVLLVVVVIACIAGWRIAAGRGHAGRAKGAVETVRTKPVRTAVAERGDIQRVLAITGSLEAERRSDVASNLSGKIDRVLVDEGAAVAAGQPLAVLDQKDSRAQVAQADAAVQAAKANVSVSRALLAALRAGSRRQELQQAEQAVRQAKASLDNASADYDRMKELVAQGAVSRQRMDAAQLQLDVARAQHESAVQRLDLAREGPRQEDIQAAEEQVQQAQAAEAQARAALRLAQVNLDSTVVRSPISGVVAKRHVEPGEALTMANLTVATVVDNSKLYVRGDVGEASIREVQRGQTASVTIDAFPGQRYRGQLVEILPAADVRSRMFSVKIRIPNPGGQLKEGMFARAEIGVERRAGVIVIPRRAVITRGQDQIVFVVDGNQAKERRVGLGLAQGDLVEVRQGLRAGEQVVAEGQHELRDGEPVAAKTEERR